MVPAVSRAVTVRRLAPACRTMPLAVQLVVPVAVPLPPRLFAHVTWVAAEAAARRLRVAGASRAVTVRRLAPAWRTMPPAVQLVVPVAVPLPPRLFAHVTWVTPTASEAVPPRARAELLAVYVGVAVGVVMVTTGAVASA